jgi:hypothetical protein
VEKESAAERRSPVAGKEKTPATGLTNNDILLSMKYPIYKSIMSKECDAGMDVGDMMWATEASRRVWDTLKAKGNFMIFVPSSMKLQQVTEEEAFKRIKRDFSALLKDRRKSREKKKGAGVDRPTEGAEGKMRSADSGGTSIPSSKKQKECHVGRKTRNSRDANFNTVVTCGVTIRENPKLYVGMYIFDLLKKDGWTSKEKPAGDNTNFIQVIYCPECDKNTAVEGEDKFTGYPALAQWAYENDYFKYNVVETEDGRAVLDKVGIFDDPYSIFDKLDGDTAPGKAFAPVQNDDNKPTSRGGNPAPGETSIPVQNHAKRPKIDIADNQAAGEETQSTSGPVQIKDGEFLHLSQHTDLFFQEWVEMLSSFDEKFAAATLVNDITGIAFYSHLIHYFEAKSSQKDFCLGSDKDIITKSFKSFEEMKAKLAKAIQENRPTENVYKNCLNHVINRLKEQLPLS